MNTPAADTSRVLSPEQRQLIGKFHDAIPHARDLGIQVEEMGRGLCVLRLEFRDILLGDPARGLIHTGVVTSMVDDACGFAVVSALDKLVPIATLDLRMDYLRPAVRDKALYVRAECYRLTRHIAFVRANAWQDSEDRCVANGTAAFMLDSRRNRRPRDHATEGTA